MTSLYTAEELKIINTYPLNRPVDLRDYIVDFVLQNPLNFPYSSYIMKRTVTNDVALKEVFNRDVVLDNLTSINRRSHSNAILAEVIHANQVTFTSMALCMYTCFHDAKMIVHQNGSDAIISLIDGIHKSVAIIDRTGSNLIVYQVSDSVNVHSMFTKHYQNIAVLSNELPVRKHYYFEHICDKEIDGKIHVLCSLATCKVPDWYHTNFEETTQCSYYGSLMDGYNILRLCDSCYSCINKYAIIKETQDDSCHTETVANLDILSKKTLK